MKRKLLVLMAIMMAAVTTAWAEVEVTVGCLTFQIDETNNCATVSKVTNTSIPDDGSVEIPAYVNYGGTDYPVTKIGYRAFKQRSRLKALTFASNSNLVEIGEEAIAECGSLTSVELPNSLTTIGKKAFYYCNALPSIELPASLLTVGEEAFSTCTALTSLVIPNNVTTIGATAFYYCSNLEEVVFGSSVTTIGHSIFSLCNKLKYITSLNETPPTVDGNSFGLQDNSQIQSVKVPQDSKSAYSSAYGWSDFKKVITEIDPNAVLEYRLVSGGAEVLFASTQDANTYSGEIEVSSTVEIGGKTYSVVAVAADGFKGCKAIPAVKLPYTITSIGANAFQGCEQLAKIYVPTASVPTLGANALDGTAAGLTIAVRDRAYDSFSGTSGWGTSLTYTRLNEIAYTTVSGAAIDVKKNSWVGPTYIYSMNDKGQGAIVYEGELTKFDFNTEDNGAFSGLTDLKTIMLPATITEMSTHTFENCTGLTTVVLPENLTELYRDVFKGCTSLTTVTLPANLNSIYDSAFEGCSSLTSLTIPANVTLIKNLAFRGCASLAELVMEPMTPCTLDGVGFKKTDTAYFEALKVKVHVVAESAYKTAEKWNSETYFNIVPFDYIKYTKTGDEILTFDSRSDFGTPVVYHYKHGNDFYIEFGEAPQIGAYAFYNCAAMTSIEIPSYITSIGNYAFYQCTGLTSIEIPSGVTSIGQAAFYKCENLTSANIPEGVTTIENETFRSCKFATIVIPSTVTTIGENAFSYGRLSSLTIPGNVKEIGKFAFYNTYLTSVTIEEGLTKIGEGAFSWCQNMKSIELPKNSLKTIEKSAFNECKALQSITIPNSVESIGQSAFIP